MAKIDKPLTWRKSSRTNQQGNCVEVALVPPTGK
ncbi:DUF397 domain-containing protein [Actinoallomurus sp. CA-142502]